MLAAAPSQFLDDGGVPAEEGVAPGERGRAVAKGAKGAAGGPESDRALEDLVERAREGDVAAFGEIVTVCGRRTHGFVLRLVGQTEDAEDVTQETFVKAWQGLSGYRRRGDFCAWLFTIARRTALNHLRRKKPTEPWPEQDMAAPPGKADSLEHRDDAQYAWEVARRLAPDQYEAMWLCYGEGFAPGEAARIMNCNPVRLRVLLHRARRLMAQWLTAAAARDASKSRFSDP